MSQKVAVFHIDLDVRTSRAPIPRIRETVGGKATFHLDPKDIGGRDLRKRRKKRVEQKLTIPVPKELEVTVKVNFWVYSDKGVLDEKA